MIRKTQLRSNEDWTECSTKERLTSMAVTLVYRLYSQLIQTSGGLQKLLAFAAESNIAEVQQHAVRYFVQVLMLRRIFVCTKKSWLPLQLFAMSRLDGIFHSFLFRSPLSGQGDFPGS